MITKIYLGILAGMSLLTFLAFAVDKRNSSKEGKGRTPEIVLLSLASFGGALGAVLGMVLLRHKTDSVTKFHFAFTIWPSLVLQIALAVLALLKGGLLG